MISSMTRRGFVASAAMVAFGAALGNMGSEVAWADTRTITNLDGSTFEAPDPVTRIAAIYGPAYESLVVLGVEELIVVQGGFTPNNYPWCDVVFKTPRVPTKIKFMSDLNMEELLSYSPDFVVNFNHPDSTKLMEEAGLCVMPVVSTPEFEFTRDLLVTLADAINTDEAISTAQRYCEYYDEKVAFVKERIAQVAEEDYPSVYFAQGSILSTIGKGSNEALVTMIGIAGGRCVTSDVEVQMLADFSPEQIAEWNPDIILLDHVGRGADHYESDPWTEQLDEIMTNEQYSTITAVQNGDVYAAPSGVFFWDSGVQRILLLLWTAQKLHPELFEDLDMAKEVQDFYAEFFRTDLSYDQAQMIMDRELPCVDEEGNVLTGDAAKEAAAEFMAAKQESAA